MAILHQATLTPSKLDLLSEWVTGPANVVDAAAAQIELIGAYRFDDPAGEVGIESHVLTGPNDSILHVPVVYRGSPEDALAESLIGTLDHSVLGPRWVYDGCADVIYVRELLRCILAEGTQVPLMVETADGPVERAPSVTVVGHATADAVVPTIESAAIERVDADTYIHVAGHTAVVHHRPTADSAAEAAYLQGSWSQGGAILAQVVANG
jgi:hypothetical protein